MDAPSSAQNDLAMQRLNLKFFTRDPVVCAQELIGCEFRWKNCSGKIVETEAYRAVGDEACHSFFRPSVREFVSKHHAGDAYVYLNYGVHWLFNIVLKGAGGEGFVLIRALEPMQGIGEMLSRRGEMKTHNLANGPGKLTRAMGINGSANGMSFLSNEDCGIFTGEKTEVIAGVRIGISKAADLPWRFGEKDSRFLSQKF